MMFPSADLHILGDDLVVDSFDHTRWWLHLLLHIVIVTGPMALLAVLIAGTLGNNVVLKVSHGPTLPNSSAQDPARTAAELSILWSTGTGSEVMQRIVVPMIGGMVSSTVLTFVVIPAGYGLVKTWQLPKAAAATVLAREPGAADVEAAVE